MSLSNKIIQAAAGGQKDPTVEEVYDASTFSGNASVNKITTGIDTLNEGGLIWTKAMNSSIDHYLWDTERGSNRTLRTNSDGTEGVSGSGEFAFNDDGFTLNLNTDYNTSGVNYVAWTFRKAPGFFDVVTYSGNGASDRDISHNLGVKPGFIAIKARNETRDWISFARGETDLTSDSVAYYGDSSNTFSFSTDDDASFAASGMSGVTDSTFNLKLADDMNSTDVNNYTNGSGVDYVAYLWAHNPTDGFIACGRYDGNGSSNKTVTLGWEPQFVMIKNIGSNAGDRPWTIFDSSRGLSSLPVNDRYLQPNVNSAEFTNDAIQTSSTGFTITTSNQIFNANTIPYFYMAIKKEES